MWDSFSNTSSSARWPRVVSRQIAQKGVKKKDGVVVVVVDAVIDKL